MLHIFDLSTDGLPQEVGLLAAPGGVLDVAMSDSYLLAAAGARGVLVARFSGSRLLGIAETIAIPGFAKHVAAVGDYAYVMTSDGVLYTLDLAAQGAAEIVGKIALGIDSRELAAGSGRLFIAAGEEGVYVLDAAGAGQSSAIPGSGAAPRVMVYDTPGTALNVEIADDFILVADGYAGLLLLRLEAPEIPISVHRGLP
jgi:hypothetical protein